MEAKTLSLFVSIFFSFTYFLHLKMCVCVCVYVRGLMLGGSVLFDSLQPRGL